MAWEKRCHPAIAENWDDRDTNEQYWWNRQKCSEKGCEEIALSFSDKCWGHLAKKEKIRYKKFILDMYRDNISLRGLSLSEINLQGVNLRKADLEGVLLYKAHLEGVDLSWARLEGAFLSEANLEWADMGWVHIERAYLWKTHLDEANLEGAYCEEAKFLGAYLERAHLLWAHLEEADFEGAHCEEAKFWKAHLEGADFELANLCGADLSEAHLEGANFNWAYFKGTDLLRAHIEGADFSFAQFRKYVKNESLSSTENEKNGLSKSKAYLNKAQKRLRRIQFFHYPPFENVTIPNIRHVTYNPYTRLYLHPFLCLKWLFYIFPHKSKDEEFDKQMLGKHNRRHKLIGRYGQIKYVGPHRQTKFIGRYLKTKFVGIDTTDLDRSQHPQLIRDIHYQQFLDAFKNRSWFHKYIMYPLWGITSYFGEMLSLWLFWAGAIITGFALAFLHSDYVSWFPQMLLNGKEIKTFTDGFYLSGLVFTSLGLGSFVPANDAAKWWILAEVMLGFIMLGSLVSFFANKFVRRD